MTQNLETAALQFGDDPTNAINRLLPSLTAQIIPGENESIPVTAPWNGRKLLDLPGHTPAQVEEIITRARTAGKIWAALSVRERCKIFKRFAALVLERQSQILDVIQIENGKSRVSALEEVLDVALLSAHYAHTAPGMLRSQRRAGAMPILTRTREIRHPKGLVGIIAPWNYPFTLAVGDALSALIAGNAVVLKPDSNTPLSALIGLQLLREAGLPRDLMQIIIGSGRTVGEQLIDHSDFIMFTGSTATGRHIAARCGERLIGFSGELGGKNPLVVLADADIERAAAGAVRACFANSGQLCVSIERIYVEESIAAEFTAAFVRETEKLRLGCNTSWDTDMGSLISEPHLQTVLRHINDAVSKGARVLAGGKQAPELGPLVLEPTILTDVPETAELYRAETFGPVVSVYAVPNAAAAIAAANDTEYGLNASLWTKQHRASSLAAQIQAGTVNINEGYGAAWASHGAPMGGMKASGVGRRHGKDGLLKYTETQTIARQHLIPVGAFPGLDNAGYAKLISRLAKALTHIRR